MPQNPPARQSVQSYGGAQLQRNGGMFVGFGVLGGHNETTFYNTDFEPTDVGLSLRIGKQHTIARTYFSYTYVDHFGDDDDWVKVGNKKYKAKSHIFALNAELMPKLPSSPLYGILGFDIGWERLNLEYRDTQSVSLGELLDGLLGNTEPRLVSASASINGLNLGIKAGIAVEITQNFQLELTGRISRSFLQKIELRDGNAVWNGKPDQKNFTGMLGLNFVF